MNTQPINLKWMKISKDIRERLLNNVWCSNCRGAVRVVEYSIEDDKLGLIIKGKCETCGGEVVRVVENQ
ncbi:hypothetical protein [Fervidibacillus halotolerans]|uniref:Uncharacterized protein n=1 Tax=Fervidibacillus halotolerans TaxID=2980027 RepID=A0A9E8M0Y6_9BACI|nr:hypothetical protein [Fervidibacillus halotolerans]WAA12890.1 hypothetical protein OE105_01715 [Fervidibacillus halotolerans]